MRIDPGNETPGAGEVPGESMPLEITSGSVARQSEVPERTEWLSNLDALPAVAKYLRRIGANAINFRAAVIRESVDGYPKILGRIAFAPAGSVTVRGTAEAPTQDEQSAIKAEFAGTEFPKLLTLNAISVPPPGVNLSDRNVFVCHDFEGKIAFIHQRYETETGKGFLPWTRWSDGRWHQMEPDTLPFYGLPGYKSKSTLVVHEGASAADRMKRLQSGELQADRFPWWPQLKHAHHIGWNGGVWAVERSDWERLAGCGWSSVIIVADNDENGMTAAKRIAAHFPANVSILAFDQRFKPGFDLANDWPDEMFDEGGRYIGPRLRDCLLPATQATRLITPEGRGRPTAVLRDEFARLVASTVEPPRIMFLHDPSRDYRPEQFNMVIAPMSDVKDTATKVFQRLECQHDRMVYRPGFASGTLTVDGGRGFNVYEGGSAPLPGDPGPWLDYLAHLIPDETDRALVMRLLATLIARPRIRMKYGLLLISTTQGVGKSTLGLILSQVLGPANVSFPSESSIVDSAFNSWLARKRLIVVNEIYSGHSRKAYDKLKPFVTDKMVAINEKGVPEYMMENWAHFIACSNSEAALHLDDEDRRWLVPTVAETNKPKEWWESLYGWLAADGPGIIATWAEGYVAGGNYVREGEHAPDSSRKRAIVEGSRSEGQQLSTSRSLRLVMAGHELC